MEILLNKPGEKVILLGNEAIVRGALEQGVDFVSTYPGTPASEIGIVFSELHKNKKYKGYFEFSTNEKVALEAGIGASFSGLKTLVAMKNFGLNVCLDALLPFIYTGSKGPTVIIVADDPSCHSSAQSEESSRFIAEAGHVPVLEPSDPQECKDFTKLAFQLSEKYEIPIIIRITTRVAHQKMPVILGKLENKIGKKGKFVKDTNRFITLPPRVLEMKKELLEKIEKIRQFSEKSEINILINAKNETGVTKAMAELPSKESLGVICSGVSYLHVMESLNELNLSLPVLKLGFFNPLPNKKIKDFIKSLDKVLVVEELEPYLEKEIKILAKEVNCKLKVVGKDLIPEIGELKPEIIISAIAELAGLKLKDKAFSGEEDESSSSLFAIAQVVENKKIKIPKRSPQLCPGCPYWLVVSAIKKSVDIKKTIFGGEIGCYMLFGNSPVNLQDYLSCMGSSVGIAHGIKKANQQNSKKPSQQKIISFVGDSSFFHAGIPALVNAIFNKSNPLIIILNNETTAMTGHQPHPADHESGNINIEAMARACGVKYAKTIDPINQKELIKTIKDFIKKDQVSVIVAKHPCLFVRKKNA
jgi:indolepyruvate ferredoxin oxidoreductase, alpha subunit